MNDDTPAGCAISMILLWALLFCAFWGTVIHFVLKWW